MGRAGSRRAKLDLENFILEKDGGADKQSKQIVSLGRGAEFVRHQQLE